MYRSEAVCVHDATIQQLQEELKALREQVASILAKNNESQGIHIATFIITRLGVSENVLDEVVIQVTHRALSE